MRGAIPPSPPRPWHFAQTPSHCSSPRGESPACSARAAPRARRRTRPAGRTSTRRRACSRARARRARCTGRRTCPGSVGLEPASRAHARDHVELALSAGIHHEWITSSSGAVTSSRTGTPAGHAQRVDRDHAVRVLVLPVELAPDDAARRAGPRPRRAAGSSEIPGAGRRRSGDERRGRRPARPSRGARGWSRRGSAPRPRSGRAAGAGTARRRGRARPRRAGRSRRRRSRRRARCRWMPSAFGDAGSTGVKPPLSRERGRCGDRGEQQEPRRMPGAGAPAAIL